jgi:uncharacterized protein YigE (DUF2233 family)
VSFAGHWYAVADVDLRSEAIAITSTVDSKPETLPAVANTFARRGGKPLLVTNAGIYGSDDRPLGLLISPEGRLQGVNRSQGRGNFFWDSAIFQTLDDHTASILDAQSWHDGPHMVAATQSGPQLASSGKVNPNLPSQSKSAFRRTAVGIDQADRHIVHIAVSDDAVTLLELATFMVNTVHCSEVLHLDGDLSAFYIPSSPGKFIFADPGERIVTALIVTKKTQNSSPRVGK